MENTIESEVELIEDVDEVEELKANDDGTFEEVYRNPKTGNIVMNPKIRNQNKDNNRRENCWNYYLQTVRDGNPNAAESARRAGFSDNTAINIRKMRWFKDRNDKLRRSKMFTNAERNIARIMNLGMTRLKKLEDGTTEEVFDAEKARIVADMSKLIVTTLGKDEGWSTKTEFKVTTLPTPIMELEVIDAAIVNPQLEEANEVTE